MSWLESIGKPEPKAQEKIEDVRMVCIQTRAPFDNDPGQVREAYWGQLSDGTVALCKRDGTVQGVSRAVQIGETPLQTAGRLLRELHESEAGESDFWRPLPREPGRVA